MGDSKPDLVDVGIDHFGYAEIQRALHQIDLFKGDFQHAPGRQDKQHHGGRQQAWDIDIANALQAAGAIHHRRFMQGWDRWWKAQPDK